MAQQVGAKSPDEIRRSATCPACDRIFREPRLLEPCEHAVCKCCLSPQAPGEAAVRGSRARCPVCQAPCTADRPYSSMSALAALLNATALIESLTVPGRSSHSPAARAVGAADGWRPIRPRTVLHFPGPPLSLQSWPGGGLAAILRDTNNQRVWAASPPHDGQVARPAFQPALGAAYTITGFCLARAATSGAGNEDWVVVLSDFYRDCLLVCDLGGQCLQQLLEVPKPGALCSEEHDADGSTTVYAVAASGAELRAFEWRRRRLRQIGVTFRHPRLSYARAIAAGADRVCVADSAASFVFVIARQRLLGGGGGGAGGSDYGVGGFACEETQPIAVAVAEFGGVGRGCVFVNSVGANQRRCVAVRDLATGQRLRELPCGFVCACGCPACGSDADIGALHFDPARLELTVSRRARANHALVFSLGVGDFESSE